MPLEWTNWSCTYWFAFSEIESARTEKELQREHDEERKKQLRRQRKQFDEEKSEARRVYRDCAAQTTTLMLPAALGLDTPPMTLQPGWLTLEIEFSLRTPWFSKDDRPFHVLDNPVRKDRVFGVTYMSAASWKGMLRWACRMQAGLREYLASGKRFEDWHEPNWILHLFGNEKGEGQDFHQGALVFYPTWFDKIGFEVINPHDRRRRAGTQPILYEVVPGRRPKADNPQEFEDGGKGSLRLLYAPWPGAKQTARWADFLPPLLEAIEQLLTKYGISAKSTVGWGTAEIGKWRGWLKEQQLIEATSRKEFQQQLEQWLKAETAA